MPGIDQFGRPVDQGTSYRWGQIISQIFHPTINSILAFATVALFGNPGRPLLDNLWWAGICIVVLITPVTLYFYRRLRKGAFSDADVSRRGERNQLFLVALGSTLAGSLVLGVLGVPIVFLRLIAASVVIVGVCGLINLRWKISLHAASIGSLAALISLLVPRNLGYTFWLIALLVGWARIRTGNHTASQVIAGWSVAAIGILLSFLL